MKAVLFDLDGVLVNSERVNIEAGVRAFRDIGIKLTAKERSLIIGRHPADYDKVFKYRFDKRAVARRHHKYYLDSYSKCRPFLSARSFLVKVKQKGFKIALVTSSDRKVVRKALKVLKPKVGFSVFVTFEDCKKRKPAPDAYLIAARKLKVEPNECVVVEDSVPGVLAAKRAGMKCIAITNSVPASRLKKADLIVKSLNDKRIWSLVC